MLKPLKGTKVSEEVDVTQIAWVHVVGVISYFVPLRHQSFQNLLVPVVFYSWLLSLVIQLDQVEVTFGCKLRIDLKSVSKKLFQKLLTLLIFLFLESAIKGLVYSWRLDWLSVCSCKIDLFLITFEYFVLSLKISDLFNSNLQRILFIKVLWLIEKL